LERSRIGLTVELFITFIIFGYLLAYIHVTVIFDFGNSTRTVSGTVSARNNVGLVWSRNIFCSGARTCDSPYRKLVCGPWRKVGSSKERVRTADECRSVPDTSLDYRVLKRNSSGDEIANVNFLYYDIVHALQNTIDSCINSATDRRGYVLERMFTKFSEITQYNGHYGVQGHSRLPISVPIESLYTTSY